MTATLERVAQDLLDQNPAPALPMHELHTLVVKEAPGIPPRIEELVRSLRRGQGGIRVLETDPHRLSVIAPRGWAVAPPGRERGGLPLASLEGRLRESVRALGEAVEPGSNVALARWACLLHQERRAQRALARRRSGENRADLR